MHYLHHYEEKQVIDLTTNQMLNEYQTNVYNEEYPAIDQQKRPTRPPQLQANSAPNYASQHSKHKTQNPNTTQILPPTPTSTTNNLETFKNTQKQQRTHNTHKQYIHTQQQSTDTHTTSNQPPSQPQRAEVKQT